MENNEKKEALNYRIQDLNNDDRPREKAMLHGIESLSNAELLAIVFGSGLPGQSVIQLSQEILNDNDNRLSKLARLSISELTRKYRGIGPAKAISLVAAFELGMRCQVDFSVADPQIVGSKTVYEIMHPHMAKLRWEEFWVLHLSRSNKVIARERLSHGGTAGTLVDVKLLMKSAIDKLSAGIIVVHNHPSGTLHPSNDDNKLTLRIKQACQLLDIRLLDHLIIAPQGFYSYLDSGTL